MIAKFKLIVPGIVLCFLIAIPAWFLGNSLPLIGSSVFSILFGMILVIFIPNLKTKLFLKTIQLEKGIKYTSKKVLQYSIILIGFQMNLYHVIQVGKQSLIVILATLVSSFITAFFVGKALKLKGKMTTLVSVGTSICGGSAIAATAPVIQAEDEDVAQAISTIFLFNLVAVFIFPLLGRSLNLSDIGFGMWAGTAINDTSSVVAASSSWSSNAGNEIALEFATIVKLTRTLMIVPITLVLALFTARKTQHENHYNLIKIFPWFVIGFILAAIINTFINLPTSLTSQFVIVGKFMIVMSMAAIGLNTNFKKLIRNGVKPITLGLCCWFAVGVVSLIIQKILGIW